MGYLIDWHCFLALRIEGHVQNDSETMAIETFLKHKKSNLLLFQINPSSQSIQAEFVHYDKTMDTVQTHPFVDKIRSKIDPNHFFDPIKLQGILFAQPDLERAWEGRRVPITR